MVAATHQTTVVSITGKGQRKLEELPDEEFHDLVDRELRRTHMNTPEADLPYLKALAEKLRHPAVIDRWIMELSVMKASAETQLGAKRADLKKVHGTITEGEYEARKREYESKRAGTMRFLNSVQQRLLEARFHRAQLHAATQDSLDLLRRAIEDHRTRTEQQEWEPTDADAALWAVVPNKE